MNVFEHALRARAEQENEARILVAQWEIDRRLVGSALQSVQMLFGHYSRHDESHSSTILVQIARMLGTSRVERLSATDLWLLLEAAYWHDLGMVVPDATARQWWRDGKLHTHAEKLGDHVDPELRRAAELLQAPPASHDLGSDWPFELKRALTLVLADYARTQHAARAQELAESPGEIGLASPRVIIPRRLYSLLGRICSLHGASFEDTLAISRVEQGVGIDDAHPRFVACMLRVGDLLDLDDGRFCPVMKASFGVLPASSAAHERKHASITHLLVSSERIEVDALCGDHEAYDETERWLAMLREEMRNLAARWSDITPSPTFGALPTLGEVRARLEGQLVFPDGRRPAFEIDREAVLELVRGANLYSDPALCIRELLQNAVDATHLRVWAEQPEDVKAIEAEAADGKSPLKALSRWLKERPIEVSIEKGKGVAAEGKTGWSIRITDRGVGISRHDLAHIQRVGGSHRNPRRREALRAMPEWLKPSGTFGIGLQSAFLLTDRIRLVTRAWNAPEILEIELRRGDDGRAGGIVVKTTTEDREIRRHGGTRVELEIEVDAVPNRVTSGDEDVRRVLASFDPVVDAELPYVAATLRAQASRFAESSVVPVRLGWRARDSVALPEAEPSAPATFRWYDHETNIELHIRAAAHRRAWIRYRGVPAESRRYWGLIELDLDLRFGTARELLQLSREKLSTGGERAVAQKVDEALGRALPRYFASLTHESDPGELAAASLLARSWKNDSAEREPLKTAWRAYRPGDEVPTLGELFDALPFVVRLPETRAGDREVRWDEAEKRLTIAGGIAPEHTFGALSILGVRILLRGEPPDAPGAVDYEITTEHSPDALPDEGLRYLLRRVYVDVGGRFFLPVPNAFADLALASDKIGPTWIREHGAPVSGPRLLAPFFVPGQLSDGVELKDLPKVVRWVSARLAKPVSDPRVAQRYIEVVEHVRRVAGSDWGGLTDDVVARAKLELSREFPP